MRGGVWQCVSKAKLSRSSDKRLGVITETSELWLFLFFSMRMHACARVCVCTLAYVCASVCDRE